MHAMATGAFPVLGKLAPSSIDLMTTLPGQR
jgi:hypothetical protein